MLDYNMKHLCLFRPKEHLYISIIFCILIIYIITLTGLSIVNYQNIQHDLSKNIITSIYSSIRFKEDDLEAFFLNRIKDRVKYPERV